jgi:hypothetical protein
VRFENDITATQADFEVDDQDFHASMREALFEEMMTLVQKLPPEIGLKFLDLVVDLVDIPGKRALVDRIRKMTGMSSPEDEQNPSPEKKKEMAMAQAAQQREMQRAEQAAQLSVEEQAAKVKKMGAEADRAIAQAEQIRAEIGAGGPSPEHQKALQDSAERAAEMEREAQDLTQKLSDRRDEILSEIEKAKIDKAAREEVAKIEAKSAKEVAEIEAKAKAEAEAATKRDDSLKAVEEALRQIEQLNATMENLNGELDDVSKRADKAEKELERQREKAEQQRQRDEDRRQREADADAKRREREQEQRQREEERRAAQGVREEVRAAAGSGHLREGRRAADR